MNSVLVCVIIASSLMASPARAQSSVTSIQVEGPVEGDICIGDNVKYRAIIQGGDPVLEVSWSRWYNGCDPPQTPVSSGGSGTSTLINMTEPKVGLVNIKVVVKFRSIQNMNSYESEKQISVPVQPPDRIELDESCLNVPRQLYTGQTPGNFLLVKFKVMRGDRQVYVAGPVEERLDRDPYPGGIGGWPTVDWSPGPYLTSSTGWIQDGKAYGNFTSQAWINLPVGSRFDEFDQYLRMVLPMGCGGTRRYNLSPGFHFQFRKHTNSSWVMVKL